MTTPRHNLWKVLIPALLIVAGAVIGLSVVKHFVGKAGHGPNGASNGHDSVELQEGAMVPDVLLKRFGGGETQLSAIPAKVVMVNFWATWCPPCRAEMPSMERLYQKLKGQGLVVLGVDLQEDAKSVQKFVEEHKLTFPILLDSDGRVGTTYGARSIPTTYIIGRDGSALGGTVGGREWDSPEMIAFFTRLLQAR